jgi:hypothetical protein
MTDPGIRVLQRAGVTGHGSHDPGRAADSGTADAMDSRVADAVVRDFYEANALRGKAPKQRQLVSGLIW